MGTYYLILTTERHRVQVPLSMQLTVQTDSRQAYNAIFALVSLMKESQTQSHAQGKYVYFRCKTDFIEAMYRIAWAVTGNQVSLDKKKTEGDTEYVITTGQDRKKKYQGTAFFEDQFFIHND